MNLKIVTNTAWPFFRNVAFEIRSALRSRCSCTIHDWGRAKPGGKILFIGTLDNRTLEYLVPLLDRSDVVYYATTEGLSHLNNSSIDTAKHVVLVAVSDFVKRMVNGLDIRVAGVVHHGISMHNREVSAQFKKELMTKVEDRNVILTVSANHSRKGLNQLLNAYSILEEHVPDVFMILHSQRHGYFDLERLIRELEIRRIWLTGSFGEKTQRQLNALYETCTAYVQPSYSEGFGLPILEAFKFDKPVIAVDAPPFNEIIKHGENGLLVPQQGVSWFDSKNSFDFKLHTYAAEDLARAMKVAVLDQKLVTKMRSEIRSERANWDSQVLYPRLLHYFN